MENKECSRCVNYGICFTKEERTRALLIGTPIIEKCEYFEKEE